MLVYFSILVFYVFFTNKKLNHNAGIIKSFLVLCSILVLATETLSYFNLLNAVNIIVFWCLFLFFLIFCLFKLRFSLKKFVYKKIIFLIHLFASLTLFQKLIIGFISTSLITLFIQGIVYPPNNWDSLTYHLTRIMHWVSNESVDHFPSHVLRNLYQPPFSEYFVLNINLIMGNDYLSNSIELLFLVFCLICINLILKKFKISLTNRLIIIFLTITIPSVLLQASTTKNDIICAFFILSTIFFSINVIENLKIDNFVFLGLSIGLGMLTKGTFYLFCSPILALLLIILLQKTIKEKSIDVLYKGALTVILVLSLNICHFYRNFQINNDILNIDVQEEKMYSNSKMNATLFLSNIIKNSGLHLTNSLDSFIKYTHTDILKTPLNNYETNYLNINYSSQTITTTHEDLVPNSYHFIIIIIAFIFFIFLYFLSKEFKKKSYLFILLIIIFQILIFNGFLKWQPWHTRLHIPIFITSMLFLGIIMEKNKLYKKLILFTMPIAVFGFYFNCIYNNIRPFITNIRYTKEIYVTDSRYKKYFANQLYLYQDYAKIMNFVDEKNIKSIGLELTDWEYPLLNNFYFERKILVDINVNNVSSKIKVKSISPDIIVSNVTNGNSINYNGKIYYNLTKENKKIWCYK